MDYSLEIDEEGYPVLDGGLRADDESFLKEIFLNIHRSKKDDSRYPLATFIQGKEIFLLPFDDALVAQGIRFENNESVVWTFLGDLHYTVPLSEIRVDDWQRLHAFVGPEKIPAVLSRKAQAAFLLALPNPEKLKPLPFRQTSNAVEWDKAYSDKVTPWDMGACNPLFEKHSARLIAESAKNFLIPGAGRAYEAILFEKAGKSVTSIDLSITAEAEFKKLFPHSKSRYLAADFFSKDFQNQNKESFDAIIENYFFVALNPEMRAQTIESVYALLKKGGYYAGVFFMRCAEGGPPHGLTQWELREYVKDKFDILEWEISPHSHPARAHMELWVRMRKD